MDCKQLKTETVGEFATRVEDLARRTELPHARMLVLDVFRRGLLPIFSKELKKSPVTTLEEALSKVSKKERDLPMEEEKPVKTDVDKLTEKMERMRLRLVQAESVARKTNGCFECFETGHSAQDCPNKSSLKSSGKKKFDSKKTENGQLRWMNAEETIDLEVDEDEYFGYMDLLDDRRVEELRSVETRPLERGEEDEKEPESKRYKIRIPRSVYERKKAMDEQKSQASGGWKSRSFEGPRTYNVEQKLALMSSGMTMAQAIDECPRVRAKVKEICERKDVRTIVAEASGTPSTTLKIGDKDVKTLIDGGASVNIISAELVKKLKLKTNSDGPVTKLTLGDGRKIFTNELVNGVPLEFGEIVVKVDFLVLKSPDYDMLLGREFLRKVNATTDWGKAKFILNYNGKAYEFYDQSLKTVESLKLIEDYRIGDLRTVGSETKEDLETIFEQFEEVFEPVADEVKLNVTHSLDVNARPIKQAAYRVSPKEDLFNYSKETVIKTKIGVEKIFERIGVDFVGPLPETKNGFKYIIVASEYLTGWPIAKATRRADADTTAKFIYEDLICNFGCPKIIQTDRGTHFNNDLIERLSHLLEFKHSLSSPYNPQTNGKVERLNGIICKSLAKLAYENQSDWSKLLNQVLFAYRIRKNTATGLSPYELLYGTSPKLTKWLEEDLGELIIEDPEHELLTLDKNRSIAERKHVPIESQYGLGELVLLKSLSSSKMEPKWNGPYTIAVVGPNNSYQLATANECIIPTWINGHRIQRYSIF